LILLTQLLKHGFQRADLLAQLLELGVRDEIVPQVPDDAIRTHLLPVLLSAII
jgi:hypothetical protein